MKQSRVRKYNHQQNLNTLQRLPAEAKALVSVYQSMTNTSHEDAQLNAIGKFINL